MKNKKARLKVIRDMAESAFPKEWKFHHRLCHRICCARKAEEYRAKFKKDLGYILSDRDLTILEAGIFFGEDQGKVSLAEDILSILEEDDGACSSLLYKKSAGQYETVP